MVLQIKLWNVLSLFVVCLYSFLLSSLRYARHATTLHPTLRHATPFQFTLLGVASRHVAPLHATAQHANPLHSTPLQATPRHAHSTPHYSFPLYAIPLHSTPLHSTPVQSSPLYPTVPYPTKNFLAFRYFSSVYSLMTVALDHTNRARILPVIIKLSLLYTVHFFVYIQDIFITWFQMLTDIIWPVSVIICLCSRFEFVLALSPNENKAVFITIDNRMNASATKDYSGDYISVNT